MAAGHEREEIWGSTPVRFIGLTHQDQIGRLYGMFDVLLAPSLWPESFGLVAREAMHYGKWVLASSLGSIGADIVPGENGWIIDPAKPETLSDVLVAIAADPEKFTQPPVLRRRLRPVGDQVDELMRLYEGILRPNSATPGKRPSVPDRPAPVNNHPAVNGFREHAEPEPRKGRPPSAPVSPAAALNGKRTRARATAGGRRAIMAEV
jgi:hypothetical protein